MTEGVENKRVFMDISIDDSLIGRIEMEVFCSIAPKTSANFVALCTGEIGKVGTNELNMCYKGSPFHRIVKHFMIQGGDITEGNGKGGRSIYGRYFDDEKFVLKHSEPYLLSMANKGPNTNSSQFFITTSNAKHCDGKHIVFGRVVKGQDVVDKIEKVKTDSNGKPRSQVIITNCGQLFKKQKVARAQEVVAQEEERNENINDASIPQCPKSWLYRDDGTQKKKDKKEKKKRRRSPSRDRRRNRSRDRSERHRKSRRSRSRSKSREHAPINDKMCRVRGRGTIRFRKDRSVTPVHWRQNAPRKFEIESKKNEPTDNSSE